MAYGTINVDTLTASTGVLATQNGMTGIAKAWVYFNGGNGNTAGVINGSFNVSSITVNGTGNFTINFSSAMTNSNLADIGTGAWGSANTGIVTKNESSQTTTSVGIFTAYQNGANYAIPAISVAIFSA